MSTSSFAQTDWDWFFSSLAQSAAAIVAIFAGFIINKILSDHTTHLSAVDEMANLLTEAHRLKEKSQALPFASYSAIVNERALKTATHLLLDGDNGGIPWDAETLLAKVQMSPFGAPEANRARLARLMDDFSAISAEERARMRFGAISIPIRSEYAPLGIGSTQSIPFRRWGVDNSTGDTERQQLAETIEMRRATRHHARVVHDFGIRADRSDDNRKAIGGWLWLVVALFFLGVIYPLSSLPASSPPVLTFNPLDAFRATPLRGVLLAGFSAAFLIVVAVFRRLNKSMKHDKGARDRLRAFTEPGAYAEAFAHANANLDE